MYDFDRLVSASFIALFLLVPLCLAAGAVIGGRSARYLIEFWASWTRKKRIAMPVSMIGVYVVTAFLTFFVPHLIGLLFVCAVGTYVCSFFFENPHYRATDESQ